MAAERIFAVLLRLGSAAKGAIAQPVCELMTCRCTPASGDVKPRVRNLIFAGRHASISSLYGHLRALR